MRRRSKNNPWRNTWEDKTKKRVDKQRIASLLLLVSIPLMCVCLVFSLLVRSQDMYRYNLRASQAVAESRKFVDEDELVQLLGDFMKGRTDTFELYETVAYEPQNLFTAQDDEAMHKARSYAVIVLWVGVASTLVSVVLLALLIRWRRRALHRSVMLATTVPMGILLAAQLLAKVVPPLRRAYYGRIIPEDFPDGDFLIWLAEKNFGLQLGIFVIIGSVLLYVIVLYANLRYTAAKKLFQGGGEVEYQKMHTPIDRL